MVPNNYECIIFENISLKEWFETALKVSELDALGIGEGDICWIKFKGKCYMCKIQRIN